MLVISLKYLKLYNKYIILPLTQIFELIIITINKKAMKKIKILLLSLSILLTVNIFAAELDVKYTNMKVVGR